ncbi:TIGR02269 family lipoprotein [Archangium violaceum]|uniref:SitA6 family polymorphic toxin lipoprotein n=1 Tax=Archangium violaceum TaxID=83451 RepID=UPI0007C6552A|nr:TIGR02269 family lipoprotein [Archangium violaceum]
MREKSLWGLLLGVLLAGCAASEPVLREQEVEREAADTCLTVLCDEEVCGFFRCEDVAVSEGAEVAPGGVVKVLDMQGLGMYPPGYSGSPMRYWGRPLPLQREQGAVFIIPWRNHHLRKLLPSQKQLIEEANRKLNRPHEKHHIFPQEFKDWFKSKGINIHQWTMWIETEQHQRIHRGPGGGPWNAAWRRFKRANEYTATKEEIWKHAWELCVRFGLMAPLQPYYGKTQLPPPIPF